MISHRPGDFFESLHLGKAEMTRLIFGLLLIPVIALSLVAYPYSAYPLETLDAAREFLAAGKLEEALASAELALAENYANPEVHETIGDILRELSLPDAATLFYERAYELFLLQAHAGTHPDVKAKMARVSGKLALISEGGPPLVADILAGSERTFYYGMNAYALESTDAQAMRAYANACISVRRYPQAEAALSKAIASRTPSGAMDGLAADLHHLRGATRYYLQDYAGCIGDYTLAESYGLVSVKLYGNWAFALEALEKWSEALEMWRKVSKMGVPAENKLMVEEHIKLCEEKLRV